MTETDQGTKQAPAPTKLGHIRLPIEPTPEMISAAWKYGNELTKEAPDPVRAYRAMVLVGIGQADQAPDIVSGSVLVSLGTSMANLARRHLQEHGQDTNVARRLDLAIRNWECLVGSRGLDDADSGLAVLEGKLLSTEQSLVKQNAEVDELRAQLLEQQTHLNEATRLLEQSVDAESVDLVERIKALPPVPVPNIEPVEWYDVVDLPAYEPGAQYLILAADQHHPCTEVNRLQPDNKRWFRGDLTGELFTLDDIEAWRPLKEHQPPTGWVPCTPEWLKCGGDCANAPRWFDGKIGNHFHPKI
ncbi:hypothetical protein ABH908_000243 [Pseudomonas frederiksbergensis]|uniref:hypothetical protein n=1 Tax=Pseudomonas TaxID=286 RepID=UPI003D2203EB